MDSPSNPCCALWKSKYEKISERRNYLRSAMSILENKINSLELEKSRLLQACDEHRNQAQLLEEAKEDQVSLRASLEDELAALKSGIASTQNPDIHSRKEELDKETALLRECISDKDAEIQRLKNQLAEEKPPPAAAKKATPSEKKKLAELHKNLKLEKSRADKSTKLAEAAKKKSEQDRLLIERLNNDVHNITQKLEETNQLFEAEKQRVLDEINNTNEERARVNELTTIVKVNEKKLADEKSHSHNLSLMLEEQKLKVENLHKELQEAMSYPKSDFSSQLDELSKNLEAVKEKVSVEKKRADSEKSEKEQHKKAAEANMIKATEEKHRADMLLQDLQSSTQRIESLLEEMAKTNSLLEAERLVSDKEKKRADALNLKLLEQQKITVEMEKSNQEKLIEILEAEKKVESEKKRADIEMSAKEELKKVSEANNKKAMEEKLRADKLLQDLQHAGQRIASLEVELGKVNDMLEAEKLLSKERNHAHALNLKLEEQRTIAVEVERSRKLSIELEVEKKNAATEKKRADLEMSAKEEQKKVSETNIKKAMEEKLRADKLLQDLQYGRQRAESLEAELEKVNSMLEAERLLLAKERNNADALKSNLEEQTRIAIDYKKKVMEEQSRSDNMNQELEDVRNKLKDVETQLYEVKESSSVAGVSIAPTEQMAKVSLLQEQLKFEKKRVKHYREVAKLEKDRKIASEQELHNVKHDFQCLLQQMDVLSDTFSARNHLNKKRRLNVQCLDLHERTPSLSPPQIDFCRDAEPRLSSLSSRDTSCHVKPNSGLADAGQPMESPSASFSDEQLLGSQERAAGSPTGTDVRNPNPQAIMASWIDRERVGTVAQKSTDHAELCVGHVNKRRKIVDESESIRCPRSQGETMTQVAASNLFDFLDVLDKPMTDQTEKVNLPVTSNNANLCGTFDLSGKKRKLPHEPLVILEKDDNSAVPMEKLISLTPATTDNRENSQPEQAVGNDPVVSRQDDLVSFEQELNGDYMKLLDLDDAAAEKQFRMALESPLSPTLPDIDLHEFDKEVDSQMLVMPVCAANNALVASGEHDKIPKFCVVFSDMEDVGCITRIFCATSTCISHLRSPVQTPWLVEDILMALALELDLVSREKVCVFFSLTLLSFVAASCTKSTESMDFQSQELVDTFSTHFLSVLLNMKTRHLFANVCSLPDLLGLSEDFLVHKKILLNICLTAPLNCEDSKIEIMHQGENNVLRHDLASASMMIAGSIVMASICVAAGLIDLLCEISLKMIRMGRADCSLTLLILHTFAHVCGDEFLTNSNYCLAMEVVRFMVVSIECSLVKNDDIQLLDGSWHRFFPSSICPFAGDSLSLDDILSKLLEVQGGTQPCHQSDTYGSSFLVAVVSAVELLAANMSWDWVCNEAVPKLFETLKLCEPEGILSNTITTLLVYIGKLRIKAVGYNDPGVKSIIEQLSAMKCNTLSTTIVQAIIQLHPNGNYFVTKNSEDRSVKGVHTASCTAASDIVTTMFSSLSSEHTSVMPPMRNRLISDIIA